MRSALPTAQLTNKRVFLRADLNVALENRKILSDYRLEALRPTLDLLINKKARIILATHIGRPQGHDEALSTKHLVSWLLDHGYQVQWAPTLSEAQNCIDSIEPGTILLLENLRFSPGETSQSQSYAEQLKSLAEYYVQDAWGVLHKGDTSLTLLPQLYSRGNKTIGLLVEREIEELDTLRNQISEGPFVLLMGGAKIKQKLPYIKDALTIADTIIVLPALAFTFLKAKGIEVGDSLVEESLLGTAKDIMRQAEEKGVKLVLPVDYMVGNKDLTGPLTYEKEIKPGKIGIALGPESLKESYRIITSAKSIFLNGAMGFLERPETLEPLKKLLQSIAQSNTLCVVGGGESVAAVNLFHLEQDISFCSTGGGSSVYYLIHGTLPTLHFLS